MALKNKFNFFQNRIKAKTKILFFLKKYKAIVIASVSTITTGVGVVGFGMGAVTEPIQIQDCSYGEELTIENEASTFLGKVQYYEYSLKDSDEWTKEVPSESGEYLVRAVTNNVFGKEKRSESTSFTISESSTPITINIPNATLNYGDLPNESNYSVTLKNEDRISNIEYLFTTKDSKDYVSIDLGTIKVVNKDNEDVTSSYYFTTEPYEVTIINKPFSIKLKDIEVDYTGKYLDKLTVFENSTLFNLVSGDTITNPVYKVFNSNNEEVDPSKVIDAGVYTVTLTDAYITNSNRYNYEFVNSTITINKIDLTINTTNETFTYDNTEHYATTVNEPSGLLEGHSAVKSEYAKIKDVGSVENIITYTIYDSDSNDVTNNYNISSNSSYGTLRVISAPLTIRSTNSNTSLISSKVYDGKNVSLNEYTISGLAENENESVIRQNIITKYSLSNSMTNCIDNVKDTGSYYACLYLDESIKNYSLSFAPISFEITKATLECTISNKTITYGDSLDKTTLTYSIDPVGLKGSDTLDNISLTTSMNYVCDYDQYDNAGNYDINGSGLSSKNYTFTYNKGILTVNKIDADYTWTIPSNAYTYTGSLLEYPTVTYINAKGLDIQMDVTLVDNTKEFINEGTYQFIANPKSTDTDYINYNFNSAYQKHSYTIGKLYIDIPTLLTDIDFNDYEYDGKTHIISYTNSSYYTLKEGSDTLEVKNPGTYNYYFELTSDAKQNCVWNNVEEGKETSDILISFTYNKKTVSLDWSNTTYTYNGLEQTKPTVSYLGVDSNTIKISSDLISISSSNTTFKDAGEYIFTVSNFNNDYYVLDESSISKTYTIDQKSIIVVVDSYSVEYGKSINIDTTLDGFEIKQGYQLASGDTKSILFNSLVVTTTYIPYTSKVGSNNKVSLSGFNSDGNYIVSVEEGIVTVIKTSATLTWDYNSDGYTYNGSNQFDDIKVSFINSNYTSDNISQSNLKDCIYITTKDNTTVLTEDNKIFKYVGTYEFYFDYSNASETIKSILDNYDLSSNNKLTVSINKLEINTPVINESYLYNGTDFALTYKVAEENDIYSYEENTEVIDIENVYNITLDFNYNLVGSNKNVTFTLIDTTNLKWKDLDTIYYETIYEVTARSIEIDVNNLTRTYGEHEVDKETITSSNLDTYITLNTNSALGQGDSLSNFFNNNVKLTLDNTTIGISGLSNSNYIITNINNGTLTINKKTVDVTWNISEVEYNGETQIVTALFVSVDGSTQILLNDYIVVKQGDLKNAGTHYLAIEGYSHDYYELSSSTINHTLTITQRHITISTNALTGINALTYTGKQVDIDTLFTVNNTVSSDNLKVSDLITKNTTYTILKNAGTYNNVTIDSIDTLTNNSNYVVDSISSGTVVINKKVLTDSNLTWDSNTYTYSGNNLISKDKVIYCSFIDASTLLTDPVYLNDYITVNKYNNEYSNNNVINAGNYELVFDFSNISSDSIINNYDFNNISSRLITVNKQTLSLPEVNKSYVYTGEKIVPIFNDSTLVENLYTVTVSEDKTVGTYDQLIKLTIKDTTNYKFSDDSSETYITGISITKANIAIVVEDRPITFNGDLEDIVYKAYINIDTVDEQEIDILKYLGTKPSSYTIDTNYVKGTSGKNDNNIYVTIDLDNDSYFGSEFAKTNCTFTIYNGSVTIKAKEVTLKLYDSNDLTKEITKLEYSYGDSDLVSNYVYGYEDINGDIIPVSTTLTDDEKTNLSNHKAGTYKLINSTIDDSNYTCEKVYNDLTINKKLLTYQVTTDETFLYGYIFNINDFDLSITGYVGTDDYSTISSLIEYTSFTNTTFKVGTTYTLSYKFKDGVTSNYDFSDNSEPLEFEVSKKNITLTWTYDSEGYEYSGDNLSSKIKVSLEDTDLRITLDQTTLSSTYLNVILKNGEETTDEFKKIGTYTLELNEDQFINSYLNSQVSNKLNGNINFVNSTIVVKINPQEITDPTYNSSYTYTGSAITPTYSNNGTFYSSYNWTKDSTISNISNVLKVGNTETDVGNDYEVQLTLLDENYVWKSSKTNTITLKYNIIKKTIYVYSDDLTVTYGSDFNSTLSLNQIHFSSSNTKIIEYTPNDVNVNGMITYTCDYVKGVNADNVYYGTIDCSLFTSSNYTIEQYPYGIKLTVAKFDSELKLYKQNGLSYDEVTKLTYNYGDSDLGTTYVYGYIDANNNLVIVNTKLQDPYLTNLSNNKVGSYTLENEDITDTNYNVADVSNTLTINKAKLTYIISSDKTFTYGYQFDIDDFSIVIEGFVNDETKLTTNIFDNIEPSYNFDIDSILQANTDYIISYKFKDNVEFNYEFDYDNCTNCKFTLSKKQISLSWTYESSGYDYNGNDLRSEIKILLKDDDLDINYECYLNNEISTVTYKNGNQLTFKENKLIDNGTYTISVDAEKLLNAYNENYVGNLNITDTVKTDIKVNKVKVLSPTIDPSYTYNGNIIQPYYSNSGTFYGDCVWNEDDAVSGISNLLSVKYNSINASTNNVLTLTLENSNLVWNETNSNILTINYAINKCKIYILGNDQSVEYGNNYSTTLTNKNYYFSSTYGAINPISPKLTYTGSVTYSCEDYVNGKGNRTTVGIYYGIIDTSVFSNETNYEVISYYSDTVKAVKLTVNPRKVNAVIENNEESIKDLYVYGDSDIPVENKIKGYITDVDGNKQYLNLVLNIGNDIGNYSIETSDLITNNLNNLYEITKATETYSISAREFNYSATIKETSKNKFVYGYSFSLDDFDITLTNLASDADYDEILAALTTVKKFNNSSCMSIKEDNEFYFTFNKDSNAISKNYSLSSSAGTISFDIDAIPIYVTSITNSHSYVYGDYIYNTHNTINTSYTIYSGDNSSTISSALNNYLISQLVLFNSNNESVQFSTQFDSVGTYTLKFKDVSSFSNWPNTLSHYKLVTDDIDELYCNLIVNKATLTVYGSSNSFNYGYSGYNYKSSININGFKFSSDRSLFTVDDLQAYTDYTSSSPVGEYYIYLDNMETELDNYEINYNLNTSIADNALNSVINVTINKIGISYTDSNNPQIIEYDPYSSYSLYSANTHYDATIYKYVDENWVEYSTSSTTIKEIGNYKVVYTIKSEYEGEYCLYNSNTSENVNTVTSYHNIVNRYLVIYLKKNVYKTFDFKSQTITSSDMSFTNLPSKYSVEVSCDNYVGIYNNDFIESCEIYPCDITVRVYDYLHNDVTSKFNISFNSEVEYCTLSLVKCYIGIKTETGSTSTDVSKTFTEFTILTQDEINEYLTIKAFKSYSYYTFINGEDLTYDDLIEFVDITFKNPITTGDFNENKTIYDATDDYPYRYQLINNTFKGISSIKVKGTEIEIDSKYFEFVAFGTGTITLYEEV